MWIGSKRSWHNNICHWCRGSHGKTPRSSWFCMLKKNDQKRGCRRPGNNARSEHQFNFTSFVVSGWDPCSHLVCKGCSLSYYSIAYLGWLVYFWNSSGSSFFSLTFHLQSAHNLLVAVEEEDFLRLLEKSQENAMVIGILADQESLGEWWHTVMVCSNNWSGLGLLQWCKWTYFEFEG